MQSCSTMSTVPTATIGPMYPSLWMATFLLVLETPCIPAQSASQLYTFEAVSWLISTTLHLSRPSQITVLGGRWVKRPLVAAYKLFALPSCLVGSNFPSFHYLSQRPTDFARAHPILYAKVANCPEQGQRLETFSWRL